MTRMYLAWLYKSIFPVLAKRLVYVVHMEVTCKQYWQKAFDCQKMTEVENDPDLLAIVLNALTELSFLEV